MSAEAEESMSESQRQVKEHYAGDANEYDCIRLQQPRGALLSSRDRAIFQKLLHYLPSEGSVLEIGAGTGRFTLLALQYFENVIATDVNTSMLEALEQKIAGSEAASRCDLQVENVFDLSLADESVRAVFSIHVIPRLRTKDDQRAALSSIARVLQPNGRILFNFRNRSSLYGLLHRGHAITYREMMNLLEEVGLDPLTVVGKHVLARKLLNILPLSAGAFLKSVDEALAETAPNLAWDVFVVAEKK